MTYSNLIQLALPIEGVIISIPLTKGYIAIVDAEDADLLQFNWQASIRKNTQYAKRSLPRENGKRPNIYMHQMVLGRKLGRELLASEQVDHKDGNGLNNCRDNLRLATHAQNMRNSKRQSNNISGFKGIRWSRKDQRWHARIRIDGVDIWLGFYDTPEEAHQAYCEAAKKYHGEFARFE